MSGLVASIRSWMRLRPRPVRLLLPAFALVCAACAPAPARAEPHGRLVPRLVVALYDGGEEATVAQTRLHRFAEMPLNVLGYKLAFWDVRRGLPAVGDQDEIAGVISWFSRPIPASAAIHRWLSETSRRGAKLIVLDEIGEGNDADATAAAAELLDKLGLRSTGSVEVTYRSKVAKLDPEIAGFERAIVPPFAPYLKLAAVRGDVATHLALASGSRSDVVVATSATGGYAGAGYTLYYEANLDRVQWMLNPFEFFRRALGQKPFPVPDTTTLSGRRIYFSHIDGDGWNNLTEVERYRGTGTTSATVVLNELIAPFPDLPVSVGVIAGDVDETLSGSTAAAPVARRLFALPQVEVASHTYTHPFDWSFFEHYARASEIALIERHFSDPRSAFQRTVDWMRSLAGKPLQNLAADRFVAFSAAMPRVYMRNPFDLGAEVAKALQVATSLAPDGKPAQLYLWSGEANPFEAALRAARLAGVENMNGGDSRYDAEFPSAAYVPPLARPVGSERQVYAAASNENTYTNDWKGPFFGFALLSQTLERTEHPRRLKPANIYYHMYSGEKPASLAAVRAQLEAARRARLAPIPASLYPKIVAGFFSARIEEIGPRSWRISDRGALQTVRIDAVGDGTVEMGSSKGVIGSTRKDGSLYVALDPAVADAVVTTVASGSAPEPRLVEGRWLMSRARLEPCRLSASVQGYGHGELTFAGLQPGRRRIRLTRGEVVLHESDADVGAAGTLALDLPPLALQPASLEVTCRAPGPA